MTRVIRAAVSNPMVLNIIFWTVTLLGLYAMVVMPKEEFPQVSAKQVIVYVAYSSGTLEDTEESILRPIEDAVKDMDGVKHMFSDAREDAGVVSVEFVLGTDVDAAAAEIERAMSNVEEFPVDAGAPWVGVARLRNPITLLGITGDIRALDVADRLSDELTNWPGVRGVSVLGAASRSVEVRLDPATMSAYGLSPVAVSDAIKAATSGVPSGEVALGPQRVVLRSLALVDSIEQIEQVVLHSSASSALTIGDVAEVIEIWDEPDTLRFVNGQPAMVLRVERTDEADAVAMVAKLHAWLPTVTLPSQMQVVSFDDSARMVRHRIFVLASNAAVGVCLVFGFLMVFIGRRNALLVLWGMPVAVFGAFLLMNTAGLTVNVVSTFALLIVTGIIVDDAIVIVENVQRHLEMGKTKREAAIDGTTEVMGAVFAATLTTCLAFAPLLMLDGAVGRVMQIIPKVVIFSLLASLLEAFIILPGHLGQHAKEVGKSGMNSATIWLQNKYRPVLAYVTGPKRYFALGAVLVLVILTGVVGSQMRMTLQTKGEPVFVNVNVTTAPSSTKEMTRDATRSVEATLAREASGMVAWSSTVVGRQEIEHEMARIGSRYGQVNVGFVYEQEVMSRVPDLLEKIRKDLAKNPLIVGVSIVSNEGGPPTGRAIDVRVRGRDIPEVNRIAAALVDALGERQGVKEIEAGMGPGLESWNLEVDPVETARFGLNPLEVGRILRTAVAGIEASDLVVSERQVPIRVTFAGLVAPDIEQIKDIPVALPNGSTVRMRSLTKLTRTTMGRTLSRVDGQRAVRITANIDESVTTSEAEGDFVQDTFQRLEQVGGGVTLFYGGAFADSAESFSSLPGSMLLAIFLIYGVLTIQFKSYLQPVIIMAAIPLGIVGVVFGLSILRMDLSFIAAIGSVGLVGIVVNDTLVLIDFANRARAQGLSARDAITQAAMTRLRPIIITTVTTVLGMLPLALGVAGREPMLEPMAVAISFGLMFATGLALIVVPALYLVVEDTAKLGRKPLTPR